ncbi:hypothetical protein WR25_22381 [Diploscapter pachys]|uniref:Uncharacterized protein n=1 Tax=Diploscapter pachys TaxID=2018661 RepID=A0A2A2L4P7_9BILA|nr:hypothetical protein WR25_22381 [Diploscapter pachys]
MQTLMSELFLVPKHWTTVIALIVTSVLLFLQILSTIFLWLAHYKNIADYVWPRLTLLICLLVCSTIVLILMASFFMGKSKSMTEFFLSAYEYIFDDILDEKERIELKSEIKFYAGALMVLEIIYICYL